MVKFYQKSVEKEKFRKKLGWGVEKKEKRLLLKTAYAIM